MIASDQSYPDPISTDDPRYQDWLMVRAFIQHEESAARAELLKALEKNGSIEASDVIRCVERSFSAAASGIVATVNSTRSDEKIATALDTLLKRLLVERYRPWFRTLEKVSGLDAPGLERQAELRLTARLQEFKAQAFRFGLDGEISCSTPEQSIVGRNNIAVRTDVSSNTDGGRGEKLYMAPFKWEEIDHSLISLKHTELTEELRGRMKKEEATIRFDNRKNLNNCTVPTLILEMQKRYTDELARRVYEIYCDVWQIQGYQKSATFIRAVCSHAVVPAIRARANAIAGEFAMFAQRTNFSPEICDAMQRGLDLDMKRLQSRWERRLEAEAKECEHAERRRLTTASDMSMPSRVLNGGKPGRKSRLPQSFVLFAGMLWRTAILESGTVSCDRLQQIAHALDAAAHLPPADYLEGKYAHEVKGFNSRHSNSKIGPLMTWSKLVSHGDKDHIQGMRRLLARCAEKLSIGDPSIGDPPSGINSGQKMSSQRLP